MDEGQRRAGAAGRPHILARGLASRVRRELKSHRSCLSCGELAPNSMLSMLTKSGSMGRPGLHHLNRVDWVWSSRHFGTGIAVGDGPNVWNTLFRVRLYLPCAAATAVAVCVGLVKLTKFCAL